MQTMKLIIDIPDGVVFDDKIRSLTAESDDGSFGIQPMKSDCVIGLSNGPVRIVCADGSEKIAAIGAGILTVKDNTVSMIVADFNWQEDIDEQVALETIERLKARLAHKDEMMHREFVLAQAAISRSEARLEALGMRRGDGSHQES